MRLQLLITAAIITAYNLLQGDLTALIGFLPLIPGSLRHIFDAATGLKIDDIAREVGGKLDEFGTAWQVRTDLVGRNAIKKPMNFRLNWERG